MLGTGNSSNRYPFSGKIICGYCGSKFIRRIHDRGAEIAWACQTHLKDIHRCPVMYVRDDAIKAALVTMFNKLIFSRRHLLKPLLQSIRESSGDENVRRMQELQQLLEGITGKKNTLRQLRAQEIVDTVMYNQELNRLTKQRTAIGQNCRHSANTHPAMLQRSQHLKSLSDLQNQAHICRSIRIICFWSISITSSFMTETTSDSA